MKRLTVLVAGVSFSKSALLHFEIRLDVTMGGLDTLMAKPQSDDSDINADLPGLAALD